MIKSCSSCNTKSSPIQILKDEHRVIEKVLDAMELAIRHQSMDRSFFEDALDFFRNFADGCHHAKEENELFPALEKAGIPNEGGPIGCMLNEHDQGRSLLKIIDENLEAAAGGDVTALNNLRHAGTDYVDLLREHIDKEDNVLFVMADQVLDDQEQESMVAAFHRTGQSNCDIDKHEKYIALADDLTKRASAVDE